MNEQMSNKLIRILGLLVLAVGLLALTLASVQSGRAGGHDYDAATTDPAGDAMGALPRHDTVKLQLFLDYNSLYIVGSFNAAIYPPGSGANAVLGYIDLDVDQNAATGSTSHVSSYVGYPQCGASGLGMDYYVHIDTWVNG